MSDYTDWSSRYTGRGAPEEPPQPTQEPPQLVTPPPGYTWAYDGRQYVLVATNTQPPIPQPVVSPYAAPRVAQPYPQGPTPPRRGVPPRQRVETCMLVKPGDRDPYAELLDGLPDLAPDAGGYDAMAGNPNPALANELAGLLNEDVPRARPVGARAPVRPSDVGDLKR